LRLVDADQPLRPEAGDLAAELGADRAARAGHEHDLPGQVLPHARALHLHRLAPQPVLHAHLAHLGQRQLGLGQEPGAVERRLPLRLDGIPSSPVFDGGRGVTRQHPRGMLPVELGLDCEGAFEIDIPDEALGTIRTVGDMVEGVTKLQAAKPPTATTTS